MDSVMVFKVCDQSDNCYFCGNRGLLDNISLETFSFECMVWSVFCNCRCQSVALVRLNFKERACCVMR